MGLAPGREVVLTFRPIHDDAPPGLPAYSACPLDPTTPRGRIDERGRKTIAARTGELDELTPEAFGEILERQARFARSARRQLRGTAYHEAGHAVFYVVRRIEFDWVVVRPQHDDPDCLDEIEHLGPFDYGRVHADGVIDINEAEHIWSERLLASLAGPAAEARHAGSGRIGLVGGDLAAARFYLRASRQLDRAQVLSDHLVLARHFVGEHWHRIDAVASALIAERYLDARRVRRLVGPLPRRRPRSIA